MTSSLSAADRFGALGSEQRVRLLRRLVEQGRADAVPAVVPPRAGSGPVPLSPAQEDLWVYESLYPGTGALNLCCAYHFDGPVDPDRLTAALTVLQSNHDILRARIFGEPGALRLDFPAEGPFPLERTDLRGTGGTFTDLAEDFRRRPFRLGGGQRLIRGLFVTRGDGRSTLLLALHHIVTDWWSFDVLHTEFADAYRAVRDGTELPGPPAIQYADFADWQRELQESGVFDARLDFWERYLADLPEPLRVPGAFGTGADFGIAQLPFHTDARTAQAVRDLARRHGTTVYGVLISAFAAFAARLGGRRDLILGTPTANRSAKGLERVIGYVMNAVPTRWRFGPGDSFTSLLTRFAADFPQVLGHAEVPVGRIVARTAPRRDAGQSPLFQWVFMYLPRQESVRRLREFSEPERIHTGGEHDLVGIVQDADDGFAGTLEVRTDRYDPAVVRHWAAGFTAMLTSLVTDPDAPLTAHHPVPAGHGGPLAAARPGPAPVTLPGLLARQAARTPDAPALDSGDEVLSYAGLADRVARLAGRLRALGAGPGRIVALALPRSAQAVVSALAVQYTGAAHLPVDPAHPAERIRLMLQEAEPVALITPAGTDRPPYAADGLPVLPLDGRAYDGDPLPARTAAPDEAAYVVYTSGSTGRPKGVVVGHRGVAALAEGFAAGLGIHAGSRVLQAGSPAFDICLAELAMAFHAGATLVVPPPGPLAGEALAEVLRERRVTAALLPPALLARTPAQDLPELRTLATGAETCPPGLPARWAADGRRVLNAYGPTEATVGITLSDPLPGDGTRPPIGRPLPGARVQVLDPLLRPAPVGVQGELYLSGDGLARGYLGRPGQSAERFVADPYGPPGSRMYRTGDLARLRPDGQLDFLGRADDQLKVNGLRVEPGEIEARLAEHPCVERAVVSLRERGLVAHIVPRPERTVDGDALREHAAARLPAAMVPAAYVAIDAVPVTPSGKIDRAALPDAPATAPDGRPGRGAATADEAVLCALCTELLGGREVSAEGDFFALGGDSVMAIQLAGRAAAEGLRFTPADVFTARTPARLAELARAAGPAAAADDGTGPVPLTPLMHWWRERGGSPDTFAMSVLLPTPPGTDAARVEAALGRLRERHAALRMRLVPGDGSWQLYAPPAADAGPALSRRVAAADRPQDAVTAAARAAAAQPDLDAAGGRMLDGVWYDRGPAGTGRLLLTLHHLAVDGVSLRIVAAELAELLAGREPATAPRTSMRRWGGLLHREAGRRTAELPWWEATLSCPEARLTDGRPAAGRRVTHTVRLPAALSDTLLGALPAAFHCGPDAVLLTALTAAGVRWRGGGPGLLVDLEGHGRTEFADQADVSGTVGWFTTLHPVLLDLTDAEGFWSGGEFAGRALKEVKERLRGTPGGGLGWGLLRHLNPEGTARLSPLPHPDLRFNYLGRIPDGTPAGFELLDSAGMPAAHAVEVDTVADGTGLTASWTYDDATIDGAEVRRLARLWSDALGVLADHASDREAGGFTASDFPLVELSQDQLDLLQEEL
ncbi:amino acid adenylation domain-containing protein [Streptomyces sp. NPDC059467]|uniref:amino acid adenylation domain-containing protein n=1 Tax=Streptomyces sp. NPDC059467 TaxID=3346844 RepID=UPI00368727C4